MDIDSRTRLDRAAAGPNFADAKSRQDLPEDSQVELVASLST